MNGKELAFRIAQVEDIPGIQVVRHAVKENRLSNPALVPDADVEDYITRRGRGWVCVDGGTIVAFAIISVMDKNVWALFVDPAFENKGIGGRLHLEMMNWYFEETDKKIWLSTAPGTRAEEFYRRKGWVQKGFTSSGEVFFEMESGEWYRMQG